jgi:type I restriction enzyme S subunit
METRPGYKLTELGPIPDDWAATPLGKGIKLLSGRHILARDYNTEGHGIPYITGPADFSDGTIQESKFTKRPATLCEPNDILVTVKGSGAGTIVVSDASYCISRQLMAVRATTWHSRYIYYSLLQNAPAFGAAVTGLIPGLSRSDILNTIVPLPPTVSEQEGIAQVLSDAEALTRSIGQLIAKKRQIKQGALHELLRPKAGWRTKKLLDIAPLQRGFDLPTRLIRKGRYPVVYSNGVLNHHEHFMVKGPGLATGRSGTLGVVQFIKENFWPHNTTLWVTDFKGNEPKFIYYLYSQIPLQKFGTGSGVPTLNRNDVHDFSAAIPDDSTEQTRIASRLTEMDAEIAALETKLAKARQIKQGMMQNLLTGRIRLI